MRESIMLSYSSRNHSNAPASKSQNAGFHDTFFGPVIHAVQASAAKRNCPVLSDADWLLLGIRRVMESSCSGRSFLQRLICADAQPPQRSHFFETLKSKRRLATVTESARSLAKAMPIRDPEAWSLLPELDSFDLYAGDGHWHGAAVHDPIDPGLDRKFATGHFFALNMRTHGLLHLASADMDARLHEHDMRALKNMPAEVLRNGAKKGRKVLYVWDRAGIDFRQWYRWKQGSGIYFISREKANMKLETIGIHRWDRTDERNAGVLADEEMATSQGVTVRRVRYQCPVTGTEYAYLTNEGTLPPGIIAHLYRLRWNIEKAFYDLKSQLGERKAWASSSTAKTMQALFMCIARNLMILCEAMLDAEHGVRNEAEAQRRRLRVDGHRAQAARADRPWNTLLGAFQSLTVRVKKLVCWLCVQLFDRPHNPPAIDTLRRLYATL